MKRSEHVILWTKVCHGNFFLDNLHPSPSKATVAIETYGYAWARQYVHETLEVRWECLVSNKRIGWQIVIFYPVTVISQWLSKSSIFPYPEMSCPFPSILTFSAAKFYYLNSVTFKFVSRQEIKGSCSYFQFANVNTCTFITFSKPVIW